MLPILPDADLLACVDALAPGLAEPVARRIRLRPARMPSRGDLSTDAALLAAAGGGQSPLDLAARLAARLACLPAVASAHVAGSGFINLSFTDQALDRILREAPREPAGLPQAVLLSASLRLPPAATAGRDHDFAAQYAHARCRSVLRTAAWLPGLVPWHPEELDASAAGRFTSGPARALLCRIEHWSRLAAAPPTERQQSDRAISLFLRDLSGHFDQVWKACADDATLRLLHPGQRSRSLANVALVLATAEVIRSGLSLLGIAAAEEIR